MPETPKRPPVVCLCGSTRFREAYIRANYDETMAGRVVLSVGAYSHAPQTAGGRTFGVTEEQKLMLDELHMRKIEMSDGILVLNVGGYVGDSTRREIAYARSLGKPVRFLEPEGQGGCLMPTVVCPAYTTGQVAALMLVSRTTVARLIDRGELPGRRVPGGRERRVDHAALVAWLEARPEFGHALVALRRGGPAGGGNGRG